MDTYTFCEKLGAVEGNRWMKSHWDNWYNEDFIKSLAEKGVIPYSLIKIVFSCSSSKRIFSSLSY